VHDACVVEHDVYATPSIKLLDNSLDVSLLGDIALGCRDLAGHVWRKIFGFDDGFGKGRLGDVAHHDRGAFAQEEDGSLEADAATGRQYCTTILTFHRCCLLLTQQPQ